MHNIPLLNLNDFSTDRKRFVEQLKTACSEIGFFSITGHGIQPSITTELRTQLELLFSLPQAEKEKLMITRNNYRGYVPLGFFTPNESGKPADQYEAYKLHTEISSDHPICSECDLYGKNKWPKQLPMFASTVKAYWAAMDHLSNQLLQAFALALSLPVWSGGRFVSTPHQVINPVGKDRISFPYFAVPRHDCVISPLVEPMPGFERPDVPVGKWQAEVWRTNWADELPDDPVYDLGTIKN